MNCFKRILPAFIIALFLSCAGDFKEITDEERQARQPQSSSSEDLLSSSSSGGSDIHVGCLVDGICWNNIREDLCIIMPGINVGESCPASSSSSFEAGSGSSSSGDSGGVVSSSSEADGEVLCVAHGICDLMESSFCSKYGEQVSSCPTSSSSTFQSSSEQASSSSIGQSSDSETQSSSSNLALNECVEIEPTWEFCYGGKIYDKCGGQDYNPSTHICNGTSATRAKCNGVDYNPLTQDCCNNANIFEKATQRCQNNIVETMCGSSWYNGATQRCENSIIETKCGSGWYNGISQGCCNDANIFEKSTQQCQNNIVETKCGSVWYNGTIQGCCNNANVYSLSTQRCEDNIVETKCGSGWFDGVTKECCNNTGVFALSTQFCSSGSIEEIVLTCDPVPTSGAAGSIINQPTLNCNNGKSAIVSKWDNAPNWNSPLPGEYTNISVTATCGTTTNLTVPCNGTFKTLCVDFDPSADTTHYGRTKKKFCDERDGKRYVYVTIDTQTWMAENLNYDVPNNTTDVCYNNTSNNCDIYGRLYNWATAMNNTASSNAIPSSRQGICPFGWHIPSDAEWTILAKYAGGTGTFGDTGTAGTKLKTTSGWNSPGNGEDSYGFAAQPGGNGSLGGSFSNINRNGYWWSTHDYTVNTAYYRTMGYNTETIYQGGNTYYDLSGNGSKTNLSSVRCLRND